MTDASDIAAIRAQFPGLDQPGLHYLDSAATAQMPEAVFEALRWFETRSRANVHGGVHRMSRSAIEAYEGARARVARFLNARADSEVIFTYGATSAINLLAHSFGARVEAGDEIVVSEAEHHSNLLPWQALAHRCGANLRVIPVRADGTLDLSDLGRLVTRRCRLIAVTHCSNVTGAVTDIATVVAAARAAGARVLIDGAQMVPHGTVDVQALDADFYAFSGHKMYGPTGIGVLWGRAELLADMPPFMVGGQMVERVTLGGASFAPPPRRFEAGTPPIAAAIGLGAAAEWLSGLGYDGIVRREARLTARLLAGLAELERVRVLGPLSAEGRRGVVSFTVEGVTPIEVCRSLDERSGVALRCGFHCAQPLLSALNAAEGAARASLGVYSDDADLDAMLGGLEEFLESPAGGSHVSNR